MSILKVLTYGEQSLRVPSTEIHKVSVKIQKLIDDMFDTMYSLDGIGLAAPQTGHNIRLFVIDAGVENNTLNPIVFINPKIIKKWGAIKSYEGCLSFPGACTYVRRYENIIVKAKDIKGRPFTIEANNGNLVSRVVQHEYDHLEGTLFVDHARDIAETDKILTEKGLARVDTSRYMEEKELENIIAEKEVLTPESDEMDSANF